MSDIGHTGTSELSPQQSFARIYPGAELALFTRDGDQASNWFRPSVDVRGTPGQPTMLVTHVGVWSTGALRRFLPLDNPIWFTGRTVVTGVDPTAVS